MTPEAYLSVKPRPLAGFVCGKAYYSIPRLSLRLSSHLAKASEYGNPRNQSTRSPSDYHDTAKKELIDTNTYGIGYRISWID